MNINNFPTTRNILTTEDFVKNDRRETWKKMFTTRRDKERLENLIKIVEEIYTTPGNTDILDNLFAQNHIGIDVRRIGNSFKLTNTDYIVNITDKEFGAIGDGLSHPVSEKFSTLELAQAFYPKATSLTQEINSLAINKAIDYVASRVTIYGDFGGKIRVQRGAYVVDETIDCTNTRQPNTLVKDNIVIFGDGHFSTFFKGRTGTKAILDATGAQFFAIEDIGFREDLQAPFEKRSKVGIYTGCFQVLPQSQNQIYNRISIFLGNDKTINNNTGTVAFWKFGAEENTHSAVYYVANRPLLMTAYDGDYQHEIHPNVGSHSVGVTTFTGECFLQAIGSFFPAIQTVDVNSIHADNIYIHGTLDPTHDYINDPIFKLNDHAIHVRGINTNSHMRGTIEGFSGCIRVYGYLEGAEINYVMGGFYNTNAGFVDLIPGAQGLLDGCEINIVTSQADNRKLVTCVGSAPQEIVTCNIRNSELYSNMPFERCILPTNVIFNPSTENVQIASVDKPMYWIKDSRVHSSTIKRKFVKTVEYNQKRVLSVKLPPLRQNNNATTMLLELNGLVTHASFGSNANTIDRFKGIVGILLRPDTGQPTINFTYETGLSMSAEPSGNDVNSIWLESNVKEVNGTATEIELLLHVETSGVNNEDVTFQGEASLFWDGHSSNAPYMIL